MNVRTFIDRPILSIVISVLIVIVGVIGLLNLPVEQFPEIAPPTVRVFAGYTGANAETVMKSVVVPIEEAVNGVEGMMYMTSKASNTGSANIGIFFRQGTDPDMAAVNVQNRVASVQGRLPADVTRSGVNVRKRQSTNIMQLTLYSPDNSFDRNFLSNYAKINLEPRISRVAGVGEVNIFGADYSMRIWLDPNKMAQRGVTPADIRNVLDEQNLEAATGTLGADSKTTFQYVLKYRGAYEEEPDYENMVIKSESDGSVLRIKDVARVELGAQSYTYIGETMGHPGVNIMVNQTPGSNANQIIKDVEKEIEAIREDLPKGIEIDELENKKNFLDESINNVVRTLFEALVLVVLVVYLFLQSFRSTIIPTVAIGVSLVGTFAALYFLGFSLNLLTLFALVLVIGTVVDDAIVVVEAVQAKFDEGVRQPYQATVEAMHGITSALILTSLVFMAVFIPVCFISGVSGTFYMQFGLTMAIAVGISCFNALTLSPALCALIMTPHENSETRKLKNSKPSFSTRFHHAFNAGFAAVQEKYAGAISGFLRHRWITSLLLVVSFAGLYLLMKTTRTGLVPNEDMGTVFVNIQAAPGTNLDETYKILKEVEERIKDIPAINIYSVVAGNSISNEQSSSTANITIKLKKWSERKGKGMDQTSVKEEIERRTDDITNAKIQVSVGNPLPGFGRTNGLDLHIIDRGGRTMEELLQVTEAFIDALNKRPEISRAYTNFSNRYPQYRVEVDAALCKANGVSPGDVLSALSGYIGGSYASNFNRFTKLYRVMVQASPEFREDETALNNIFVRSKSGQMSPIGQYVTLTRIYGSETLSRFNLFPSIQLSGTVAEGYSSSQALEAVRETAAEVLPTGYGYDMGGMTREEASASDTTALVFVLCIVFIYLILCALYESLFIPLAVILSVPFGLCGAFIFARMWGLENNIYMQTGLIMLIGLLAKTAILLTEYASTRRRQGMKITLAALDAAKVRLRPILMTSMTMIFGLLPLAFSTGAGANGNRSLGVGTIGGMLIGSVALLFIVPVLFIFFQWLEEKVMPKRLPSTSSADASQTGE